MRSRASRLYEDAFGAKFAVGIASREQRRSLLLASLNLAFAFGAIIDDQLVGLAGYKTPEGSFTDGITYRKLLQHAGLVRGHWAAIVFSFYERSVASDQLLMDGIVVDASKRGQGIGTQLLNKAGAFGRTNGYATLRLDVVDTNPHARRMYERNGFMATRTESFGYLRWLLGFGASTTMVRQLATDHSSEAQH